MAISSLPKNQPWVRMRFTEVFSKVRFGPLTNHVSNFDNVSNLQASNGCARESSIFWALEIWAVESTSRNATTLIASGACMRWWSSSQTVTFSKRRTIRNLLELRTLLRFSRSQDFWKGFATCKSAAVQSERVSTARRIWFWTSSKFWKSRLPSVRHASTASCNLHSVINKHSNL